MTKRDAQEFWWYSQGFLRAAEQIWRRSQKRDPRNRRKRTHVAKGMFHAAMIARLAIKTRIDR